MKDDPSSRGGHQRQPDQLRKPRAIAWDRAASVGPSHHETAAGGRACTTGTTGVLQGRRACSVVEPDAEAAEAYATYYQKWLTMAKWLDDLGQTLG